MKKETVKRLFDQTRVKAAGAVLAAAIVAGGVFAVNQETVTAPQPVTYVDTYETVEVEEEEVPLASATVTKSTKTKKSTKNIKLKTAAKKTYTQKGKVTKKTSTKTVKTSKNTTKTQTVTATQVASAYKKKSKVCKQTTVVTTTVTKTVTPKTTTSSSTAKTSTSKSSTSSTSTTATISTLAPKTDSRVVSAWNKLGFKFVVNSSVSYSGLFDANTKTITLKKTGDTAYHELGHFLAYVAGNVDLTSSFQKIFQEEKSKYTAYNKAYVLQDASEYFAESFKEYTLDAATLKQNRPKTYQAIQSALSTLTSSYITKMAKLL